MGDSQELQERKIDSKKVFSGELLHVYQDHAKLPNDHTAVREWIKHPGAAAVVPVFENGDIMLVKQFRYPLRKIFYEVPAGKIDAGETPAKTAARELKEEAGLICDKLHTLGPFHPSIGYTDEVIQLYCGWGITVKEAKTDEDEFLQSLRLPFVKAVEMIENGKITDGKSMVSLLMAWRWWQREGPFEIG